MNKLLIVFLAITLVSVHAFVKRDAPPASEKNFMEQIEKKFEEFKKNMDENLKKTFDPEEIKRNFGQMVDNAAKAFKTDSPK